MQVIVAALVTPGAGGTLARVFTPGVTRIDGLCGCALVVPIGEPDDVADGAVVWHQPIVCGHKPGSDRLVASRAQLGDRCFRLGACRMRRSDQPTRARV